MSPKALLPYNTDSTRVRETFSFSNEAEVALVAIHKLIPYQKVEVYFSISKCKIALVDMKRAQVEVKAQIQI